MKVDLVTESAVSPYLADAIYRDAVVIYGIRAILNEASC